MPEDVSHSAPTPMTHNDTALNDEDEEQVGLKLDYVDFLDGLFD